MAVQRGKSSSRLIKSSGKKANPLETLLTLRQYPQKLEIVIWEYNPILLYQSRNASLVDSHHVKQFGKQDDDSICEFGINENPF